MALGRGAEERGSFSWYFSFKRKKLKKWHIRLISTLWKVIQFWGLTFFQGWVARGAEVVWGHSPVGWISMHLPAWRILTYALNSREDTNAPITRADTLLGRVPMHLSLGRIRVQSPTGRKPMHSPAGWTPRCSQLRWITMYWAKKAFELHTDTEISFGLYYHWNHIKTENLRFPPPLTRGREWRAVGFTVKIAFELSPWHWNII